MSGLRSFPVLRVFGGLLLLAAGILAYFGVSFGIYSALVLVFGGIVAFAVVAAGTRPHPWDVAIFLIGVVLLSGVTAGYGNGGTITVYSATISQVHASRFSLIVSAATGSVDVTFSEVPGLAYLVNFTRQLPFVFWPLGGDTVTNSTNGGVFALRVNAASDVSIVLGRAFSTDVTVRSDTGSISLEGSGVLPLRNVTLVSSTGEVSGVFDTTTVQSLDLESATGSVNLDSNLLGTGSVSAPIDVKSSTGSVSVHADFQSSDQVILTANTNLGSISHSLNGFTVTTDTRTSLDAHAGTPLAARGSFAVSASSNLGSVTLTMGILLIF
jgi:hypothetical protein